MWSFEFFKGKNFREQKLLRVKKKRGYWNKFRWKNFHVSKKKFIFAWKTFADGQKKEDFFWNFL